MYVSLMISIITSLLFRFSSSRLIVGSSVKTSSPNSAQEIASRMAEVGRVTVSLRKSMTAIMNLRL